MLGTSAIKCIGCEFKGIKTAVYAGTRCARAKKKPFTTGVALGAKQVYKKVGVLPIATGIATAVAVPVPGACATGIVLGNLIKKPIKSLLKLLKR